MQLLQIAFLSAFVLANVAASLAIDQPNTTLENSPFIGFDALPLEQSSKVSCEDCNFEGDYVQAELETAFSIKLNQTYYGVQSVKEPRGWPYPVEGPCIRTRFGDERNRGGYAIYIDGGEACKREGLDMLYDYIRIRRQCNLCGNRKFKAGNPQCRTMIHAVGQCGDSNEPSPEQIRGTDD